MTPGGQELPNKLKIVALTHREFKLFGLSPDVHLQAAGAGGGTAPARPSIPGFPAIVNWVPCGYSETLAGAGGRCLGPPPAGAERTRHKRERPRRPGHQEATRKPPDAPGVAMQDRYQRTKVRYRAGTRLPSASMARTSRPFHSFTSLRPASILLRSPTMTKTSLVESRALPARITSVAFDARTLAA
jgi:hypothetical protein